MLRNLDSRLHVAGRVSGIVCRVVVRVRVPGGVIAGILMLQRIAMMMSTTRRGESGMNDLYLLDEIGAVWTTIVLLLVVDGAVQR